MIFLLQLKDLVFNFFTRGAWGRAQGERLMMDAEHMDTRAIHWTRRIPGVRFTRDDFED